MVNNIVENVSLKNYNTYKVDGTSKYFIKVNNKEELINVLNYLKEHNIKYFIIGAGSNLIIDNYFDGAIIKLELTNITQDGEYVTAEAGAMMGALTTFTINNNLTGLEWATNIPGTVGGSINNNSGAYNSEIFDNLVSIEVLDSNLEFKTLTKDKIKYGYRYTNIKDLNLIIIGATFKLAKGSKEESLELIKNRRERRMATQPLDLPSAGSVFRNPERDHAGRLIEAAGLKGYTIGGASVSLKHANFIVNTGNATSKDIKDLIKLVHDRVLDKYGIDLILEQEILDWK